MVLRTPAPAGTGATSRSTSWAGTWVALAAFLAVSFVVAALGGMFTASLLIPYLLWVSFAAVLNAGIWRLN